MTIGRFPQEIVSLIGEYLATPRLLDWIDPTKLLASGFKQNPLAWESELPLGDSTYKIASSSHPTAIAVIRVVGSFGESISPILSNPAHIQIAFQHFQDAVDRPYIHDHVKLLFSKNPHPIAIGYLSKHNQYIDICGFNMNPGAIQWLRENPSMINLSNICANPEAIDIIQNLDRPSWMFLSANPHPWAINQLRLHPEKIDWYFFSTNPGIFCRRPDPGITAELTSLAW